MVASGDFTGTPGNTSEVPLVIGALRHDPAPTGFVAHFGGVIDEVEIFDRALSDAEIRAVFEAGTAGKRKPPGIAPPAGMVSWWPGDGNANDILGGNHGTLSGDATATADGMVGQAFSFDGTDDFVEVPHNASLNLPQFSVDAWVFIDPALNAGQINAFVGKSNGAGGGGGFWLIHDDRRLPASIDNTTNALRFTVLGGPGISSDAPLKNAVPEAEFYHLAGVFDGSRSRLYLNGTLAATGPVIAGVLFNTLPLRIAAMKDIGFGSDDRFEGLVDEVEIFNRALSAAEVRAIFEAGSAGKRKPSGIAPPAGMVSWWPGDGNASDIVDGNHGTLTGDATFAPGKVGQAFSFDGVDDVVEIADSSGLVPGPGGLTIEAWVNPNTGGQIFSDHFGCVNWESTELNTSHFTINSNNLSSTRQSLTFATLPLGLWSHIGAVWDGSEMLVYVNGEVVATASAPNPPWNPSSPFVIGGRKATHDCQGVGTGFFTSEIAGLADELGYFDRALSAGEIMAIFETGSAGKRKP